MASLLDHGDAQIFVLDGNCAAASVVRIGQDLPRGTGWAQQAAPYGTKGIGTQKAPPVQNRTHTGTRRAAALPMVREFIRELSPTALIWPISTRHP